LHGIFCGGQAKLQQVRKELSHERQQGMQLREELRLLVSGAFRSQYFTASQAAQDLELLLILPGIKRTMIQLFVAPCGRIRCFKRKLGSSDCAGLNGAERRLLVTVLIHKHRLG
jgi:hypothetical protein